MGHEAALFRARTHFSSGRRRGWFIVRVVRGLLGVVGVVGVVGGLLGVVGVVEEVAPTHRTTSSGCLPSINSLNIKAPGGEHD